MTDSRPDTAGERQFFSHHDGERNRRMAWSSIPHFRRMLHRALDLNGEAGKLLAGRTQIRALTLACGDMTGEYPVLRSLGATHIDAFDVTEAQRHRFFDAVYDGAVPVDYRVEDVNAVRLPRDGYDLVYVQQAYHHLTEVEHVAREVRGCLKADGVFVLSDYVGAPFLQRTERQRDLASRIWAILPERLRTDADGNVCEHIRIPPKESLSPYEAIHSDRILPALREHFEARRLFLYAGILFPVFNGFAQNYTESGADKLVVELLWQIDRFLIEQGAIEPNFVNGIFTKRPES